MANFVQNAQLRATLLFGARIYARLRIWGEGPRVFVNSIPKAGTHLLTSVLEDSSNLFNSREHIQLHEINRLNRGAERAYDVELDAQAFARRASRIRNGQLFSGHIFWDEEVHEVLDKQEIKTVFVIRDPRDIIISASHYIAGLRRHPKHQTFVAEDMSDGERFDLELYGRPETAEFSAGPKFRPLRMRLERYLGWLGAPNVLTVKFEDLVGARGGMSDALRDEKFAELSDFLGVPVRPRDVGPTSATFRKGQAFGWKTVLSDDQIRKVRDECGDLIEALGYEP